MPTKERPHLSVQPSYFRRDPQDHAVPRNLQKHTPAEELAGYADGPSTYHTLFHTFAIPTIERVFPTFTEN